MTTPELFLSTPSARRATRGTSGPMLPFRDFYPRPPRGGRRDDIAGVGHILVRFLSTPSARRATGYSDNACGCEDISIHALREEGDATSSKATTARSTFLSTPSARRATRCPLLPAQHENQFLSTPSARRATLGTAALIQSKEISIHALREEGDHATNRSCGADRISIHALREEGDSTCRISIFIAYNFYPRPPRGGRPRQKRKYFHAQRISIHALREEGDFAANELDRTAERFLSTPSARRATFQRTSPQSAGSDFYPRPPRGGRRGPTSSE